MHCNVEVTWVQSYADIYNREKKQSIIGPLAIELSREYVVC